MNFNDDDNDNRNINNGEIDFDQINRTSANVRFYNRVIWASIFIIILAGAGCGIYLYSYISSGIKNEIVRPEPEIKKSEKAVKEGTTAHGPVPVQERPAAAASANKSHLAQPEPAATHRGHPGSEKTASVILKQQPAAQTTLKPVSPPAAVSVAATSEVAAAVSHGAPATSETAVSKETAGVEIVLAAVAGETKGTAEVSAAEVYKPDVSLLEKKLARANYSEFETEEITEAQSQQLVSK